MTANHDQDRDRRQQPGVSGDLVAPLRTLRERFGADQVEVIDVTPNTPPARTTLRARHRTRQQREERQR